MSTESANEPAEKKGKKNSAYSFLEGIEGFVEEEKRLSSSDEKKNGESDDAKGAVKLNLFASLAQKEGKTATQGKKKSKDAAGYSFLEGIETEPVSEQLTGRRSKKEGIVKLQTPAPKKAETAHTEVKLGGLIGKVLTGELKAESEDEGVLSGLSDLEKSAQMGKEVTGEIIESGKGYRIVKNKGEKSPTYLVTLPKLTEDEKKLLVTIGKRAISEINIDPEALQDYAEKKKVFTVKVMELINRHYPDIKKATKLWFATFIVQDMIGYGIIDPLLSNDDLEEVILV